MGAAAGAGRAKGHARVPWGDVLMSAVAAVSWALIGMAGTAALGLRLLEADAAGSLGPMTAAVVALGAGGSVTPSGDVSVFGLSGAEADTAIEITPLGVSLVGAVLLSWFFLRSLRGAGVVVAPAELLARAGSVVVLFVAMLGGLAWAGHDVITIDGGSLGLDDVPGGRGGVEIPGLGDVGGLLPDRLGDLVDARAAVGFTVDTVPTLLGGFGWSAGILLIALLASRRTPLPRGWEAVHRVVRPAVSAVVTVLLVAVAAGCAAAVYAAVGDDHPRRIAGAALLGAPNGVWLGVPLGLFVPWDGQATGELTRFLPDPLDDLLGAGSGGPVTLSRLAELDSRVWLLGVAAASMMLFAGVLAGVRTPVGAGESALGFAGRCALRLGVATASALPLLVWLTDVSASASLSVLGFDAFGAGIELHGRPATALLLGALWGAASGATGALLAWGCGAAGRRSTAWARAAGHGAGAGAPGHGGVAGGAGHGAAAGAAGHGTGAGAAGHGTGARTAGHGTGARAAGHGTGAGAAGHGAGAGAGAAAGVEAGAAAGAGQAEGGPYTPRTPYRPPDPGTNPYLRVPDELREPEDARPPGAERVAGAAAGPESGIRPDDEPPAPGDVHGAPTVVRPVGPPPRGPRRTPGPRDGIGRPERPDDGPPPPPPPPPRKPPGGR
ncbi:streptophobe family protein [Streptomyces sp. NPDC059696]|uniref:streptophobe family protein n=1 Tax=Streptomyces sp. NPDC059696 TaxID=3346911 RepID=UPI0036B99AE4